MHLSSNRILPHTFKRSLVIALGLVLALYALIQLGAPGHIALAAGTITGTVFQDFNADGNFNTTAATGISRDRHIAGVTVTAYDSSGTQRGQTTTVRCTAAATPQSFCTGADTGPNYSLSATGTGPYRIEFTWDNTSGSLLDFEHSAQSTDSVNGGTTTNSGSTVQFVSDGNTSNVNLALNRSCDYCQNNPELVTTRFENGARTGNTNGSILSMAYNPTTHTNDEQIQNTGAVWGVAYDGYKKRVYTSAFLKRHVDLGPRGMDGVYVMDYSSGSGTLIGGFDLQGVTANNNGMIDLGTVTRTGGTNYTLGTSANANIDLDAFAKVGKTGYGDIDFGADNKSLWMVNLYQRTLIKVDTSQVTVSATNPNTISSAAVNHYNIVSGGPSDVTISGAPGCTSGNLRPFGLKIRGTLGYLGVVCDAASSSTLKNPPELIGYVLSFSTSNPTSFTQLLSIPFTYNREPYYQMKTSTNRVDAQWQRWMDTWSDANINTPATTGCCGDFRSAPSPVLSDIEFMPDGSLILGIMDRFSEQSGWANRKALAGDTTALQYGSAGDVLYAKYNSGAGTYTLESGENDPGDPSGNNYPGYRTDDSPGNGGEYFYGDAFTGSDATHGETTLGSLAYMPGADRVFSPSYDPNNFYTQGLIWQPTTPGNQLGAYAVVDSSPFNSPTEFGKANGMGDMELLCDAAPIEIGNRVWRDDNGNGIQDPNEMAMAGLTVQLWADTDNDGIVDTQVGTATTDANGEYYFGGVDNTNMLANSSSPLSVSTRIAASSDDAEQTVSTGAVTITSGTINVPRSTTNTQLDGLRFQNITIPQGATITSANIQFTANAGDTSTTVNAVIRGEATDDATTFAATTNNISARTTTSASAAWTGIGSWTNGQTTNATTPDLAGIVQEIVNRGNWASGNAMSFIISDNSSSANTQRRAYSYDNTPGSAALLTVNYNLSYSVTPATAHQIRIDPTAGNNSTLLTGLTVTTQNAAQPANSNASATNNNSITDVADNDASKSGNNYVINYTTGSSGANNLSLDFGFAPLGSIGNKVWLDENSNGYQDEGEDGLPNITVQLKNSGGTVIATTVTDANGNYLFKDLAAGSYFVQVLGSSIPSGMTQTTTYPNSGADLFNQNQSSGNGYGVTLSAGQDNLTADFGYNWNPTTDVTGGGAANASAALGDRVWIDTNGNGYQDSGEVGVRGATVTLYYAAQNDGVYDDLYTVSGYSATRTTDANGNYMFDSLPPGAYVVQVTSDSGASHAILTAGQYNQTGDADHWGTTGTVNDNKTTTPVVLGPGDVFLDADFGYQPSGATLGSIGDFVWFDQNADGAQTGEIGIGGVTVALIRDTNANGVWDSGEAVIATTHTSNGTEDVDGDNSTDALGFYRFRGLSIADGAGTDDYLVWVNDTDRALDGLRATYDKDGSAAPSSGLVTGLGISAATNLGTTGTGAYGTNTATDQDFGYTGDGSGQRTSSANLSSPTNAGVIGNFVWLDVNNNGIGPNGNGNAGSENTEVGIPDVRVNLYDSSGAVVATTTTGTDGYYLFPNLPTSSGGIAYTVKIDTTTLPGGLTQTYDKDGTGSANQSTVTLTNAAPSDLTQDFGYRGTGTIGNFVWNDKNADGVYQANGADGVGSTEDDEAGIQYVTLDLYFDTNRNGKLDAGEPKLGTTTTDSSGAYLFSGLPTNDGSGSAYYVVDVTDTKGILSGWWHSLGTAGTNNNSQTDPYAVTLTNAAPNYLNADFGYYDKYAAVGNFVFTDTNANGIQDAGEAGINGVVVKLTITYPNGTVTTLYTTTGNDPSTTGTTEAGWYSFGNLLQDENYNVTGGTGPTFSISVATADNTGALAGLVKTNADQGANDKLDSDNQTGVSATALKGVTTVTQNATAGNESTIVSYDFGYTTPVNIGNFIWYDTNNNGTYDSATEVGINGVNVDLYRDTNGNGSYDSGTDTLIGSTSTSGGGAYNFTLLTPSISGTNSTKYLVVLRDTNFTSGVLAGYRPSGTSVGSNLSDASPTVNNKNHGTVSGTLGQTGGIVVNNATVMNLSGQPDTAADTDSTNGNLTVDFGFYKLSLTGTVFLDTSTKNGTLDSGETPSGGAESGLTVKLYADTNSNGSYDAGDTLVASTTTDATGNYTFTNLTSGTAYIVDVMPQATYHSTIDTFDQTDTNTPSTGTNNNDNGVGQTYVNVYSKAFALTAGSTASFNTVTNSTGTTSNDRLDFGLSNTPTSADMGSVTAEANEDGTVSVKWETLNETLIVGFNVLRSDSKKGDVTTLNADVIPTQSLGENVGHAYAYDDASAAASTTYYYRLEILRADGSSEQTQPIKVKTQADACAGKPDATTLLTPEDGKKVKKAKVTFTWSAVNCAASYTWQLRGDSTDGQVIANKKGLTETTTNIKKLDGGRTYYWRVLTCNADGKCTSGSWWSINVKAAKAKPNKTSTP